MKTIVISLLIILSGAAFSQDCVLTVNAKDVKLTWTGFKTPAKAPVKGTFDDLGLEKDSLSSKNIEGLLTGVKFKISTPSLNTKNKQRDQQILEFFFKQVKEIKGSILKASDSSLIVEVEMNKVTKQVAMIANLEGDHFIAHGAIDILDFAMGENLKSLTKAVFELHAGKTWSDVQLELTAKITKKCE